VSNLDFEKCVSVGLGHYEGAIFWGSLGLPVLVHNCLIIQRDQEFVFKNGKI